MYIIYLHYLHVLCSLIASENVHCVCPFHSQEAKENPGRQVDKMNSLYHFIRIRFAGGESWSPRTTFGCFSQPALVWFFLLGFLRHVTQKWDFLRRAKKCDGDHVRENHWCHWWKISQIMLMKSPWKIQVNSTVVSLGGILFLLESSHISAAERAKNSCCLFHWVFTVWVASAHSKKYARQFGSAFHF